MIQKIAEGVYKLKFQIFSSDCYLIEQDNKKILVDAGSQMAINELQRDFSELNLNFDDIDLLLLTHMHWDHCGNASLFKKAKVYASEDEIEDFKRNPIGTLESSDSSLIIELKKIAIKPSNNLKIKGIRVLDVPGHTRGSAAFYLEKEKILFSGDTLFEKRGRIIGRTDLKTSAPEKISESVKKLLSLDIQVLCPGHDV